VRPPSRKARKKSDSAPPRIISCTKCQGNGLQEAAATCYNTKLPDVAIIGGGLAGLALAAACRHRGIRHTVYERDAHFHDRSQGYGLTMQQASKALEGFGILKLSQGITSTKHLVHTPDGLIVGQWGLRHWGRSSNKEAPRRQNVHIARQALRQELLEVAQPENIQWNHRLLEYTEQEDHVELTFQIGKEIVQRKADLLVGADGIRSHVRQLLIGDELTPLRYLDCIVILGITQPLTLDSGLLDGETVFQTADGTTRIYAMPYSSGGTYMWQLSFPLEKDEAAQLSQQGAAALKQKAMELCSTWHDPIPQLLQSTPEDLVSGYPVYDRALLTPSDLSTSQRVTLIGDAAHPMSPFKGQGANQALLDALQLARCLYKQTPLAQFEQDMLKRSAVKVHASAQAAQFLHSPVAIQEGNVTRGAAAAAAAANKSTGNEQD
jgi:salicylate hydroxylase